MKKIDLSGLYRYETDEANVGILQEFYKRKLSGSGFKLPGSTCDNQIGRALEPFNEMNPESVRCLRPRYDYVGPLWLQTEIDISKEDSEKALTLFLERVNMASQLWMDGNQIGRQIIELSTPHCYDLTGKLSEGRHTLTLRIDNTNLINIDGMASGYSRDTQSIWNGIIGRMELQIQERIHIERMDLYPEEEGVKVKLVVCSTCKKPFDRLSASIGLQAITPDGHYLTKRTFPVVLSQKKQVITLMYPLNEPNESIAYWDEFHPNLYQMLADIRLETLEKEVSLNQQQKQSETKSTQNECESSNQYTDPIMATFGMRQVLAEGRHILLNHRRLSLRGTLDCGIYPLTGYPPMEEEAWLETFRVIKSYGLNHVRFHAWCPPEAAFAAADQIGIYLLAEMPFWLNTDVCSLAAGDDGIHRTYFTQEAINISKAFGNHPSFILFSNGNELLGDFELLEDLTAQIKAIDPRRLYTLTSNFDHPVADCEDYISAFTLNDYPLRVQRCHEEAAKYTGVNFDEAVHSVSVPAISFEVGQYCVYPKVESMKDYTGNLFPSNLEVIKKDMEEKHILERNEWYVKGSGKFAALLYKEEIEAALRTKELAGIQLLGLNDYMGQCTATVGVLDAFWKSKGLITAEDFAHFCGPVVPLLKANRIYTSEEILEAELDVYQYGENPILEPQYDFILYKGEEKFYEVKTKKNRVAVLLNSINEPTLLKAVLKVQQYENSWDIFVYPAYEKEHSLFHLPMTIDEAEAQVYVCRQPDDRLMACTKNGGKALMLPQEEHLAHPLKGSFIPVFWSPAFFETDRACGILCEADHNIFKTFPTAETCHYQWKEPLEHSVSADLSGLARDFKMLVEPIPNFYDNTLRSPLFEMQVGKADILFCGFDLAYPSVTMQALKNSILQYVSSTQFMPAQVLDEKAFLSLFNEK